MAYRSNDGLDPSSTTDAYSGSGRGNTGDGRSNDGLATSNTTDAYSSGGMSGRGNIGGIRSNDGLDTSNTTDAYGGRGDEGLGSSRRTDAGISSGTAGKYDRSAGGNYDDPSYGGKPSTIPYHLLLHPNTYQSGPPAG